VLVLASVEAVVNLVRRTEAGDDREGFGIIQAHIQNIVSNIELLHKNAAALHNG
jgi:Mg2+ and Co2+ transporter CorA